MNAPPPSPPWSLPPGMAAATLTATLGAARRRRRHRQARRISSAALLGAAAALGLQAMGGAPGPEAGAGNSGGTFLTQQSRLLPLKTPGGASSSTPGGPGASSFPLPADLSGPVVSPGLTTSPLLISAAGDAFTGDAPFSRDILSSNDAPRSGEAPASGDIPASGENPGTPRPLLAPPSPAPAAFAAASGKTPSSFLLVRTAPAAIVRTRPEPTGISTPPSAIVRTQPEPAEVSAPPPAIVRTRPEPAEISAPPPEPRAVLTVSTRSLPPPMIITTARTAVPRPIATGDRPQSPAPASDADLFALADGRPAALCRLTSGDTRWFWLDRPPGS